MTTFKSALSICGLSQPQAADFLDVALPTVKAWAQGKRSVPGGVWDMLADLYARIEAAADHAAVELDGVDPRQWGNITADTGDDPLPGGADSAAGAMALLTAVKDAY
ncbi:MAG: helix-turn-helix domain-containing protein [Pikeienuella sp.]